MNAKEFHRKSGQPLSLCEAYVRAGLALDQVSPQYAVNERGFTRAEDQALEVYYRSNLKPAGECT